MQKKKINQENFDKSLMICPDEDDKYCESYAMLLKKVQKRDRNFTTFYSYERIRKLYHIF